MRVCIVGASGKLGQYMVQQSLDRGYEVVGVCREQSVGKLDAFKGRITVIPGATDDREVIKRAVAGCDGVLVVMTPRGVHGYSTGTTQAVLDYAPPGARLIFSCGWHITLDGQDVYSLKLKTLVKVFGPLARLARFADLDDQVEAARRIFASDRRWTVVRGSDLEEGESQGLPVWSRHVGDPILESNITRRVDFALFMVEALDNDELVHEAPAIVGRQTPILGLFVPMALVFIIDRGRGVRATLPATLTCGIAFAVAQFATSNYFSTQLAARHHVLQGKPSTLKHASRDLVCLPRDDLGMTLARFSGSSSF